MINVGSEETDHFIFADGQMATLIRGFDWSKTALGPLNTWPAPLLTTVNQILDSSFPMFIWWGDEKIQFYNDAYLQILGTDLHSKHPKALGQQGEDCWKEIWPIINPLLESVLQTGKPVYLEDQLIPIYRHGQLDDVYWTFSYNIIRASNGKPAGILVICSETTQKVLFQQELAALNEELASSNEELSTTNEELHESQQKLLELNNELEDRVVARGKELEGARNIANLQKTRLATIISQLPAGLAILTGTEMKLEMANAYMLDLWQKDETAIGKALLEFLPGLKEQAFPQLLNDVYTTGIPYFSSDAPVVLDRKGKNETVYMDFSYTLIKANAGNPDSILVLAEDVTERSLSRQREQQLTEELTATNEDLATNLLQLRESELNLQMATDSTGMGTWKADLTTNELYLSPRSREIQGVPEDCNLTLTESFAMIDPEHRHHVQQLINEAVAHGTPFVTEYQINPMNGNELRWLRSTGVIQTGNHGRAEFITGSIFDITEQRQDDLRKNDFIGMVSHELKTPLTSLTAYIQVLLSKANKTEDTFAASSLDKANKQVKKMTKIINGFLNVSRLEAGKIHIAKQTFDMAQLMVEAEEETTSMISSHQIVFAPVEPTFVCADRDKIGQVINNYISNAVKYSPAGSTINVACVTLNGVAHVSVKDQGIGVAAEDLSKLFERYYRSANTGSVSGFGIGLYLCAEIIRRHEGNTWANSEVGKGSTFYFTLPLAD